MFELSNYVSPQNAGKPPYKRNIVIEKLEEEHSSDENARFESNTISEHDPMEPFHAEESMVSMITSPILKLRSVSTDSYQVLRNELQAAKDNFQEFLFNRQLDNHETALKSTKAKFKDCEPAFSP